MRRSRALPAFALKFHARAQTIPQDQHDAMSELVIQSFEMAQTALAVVGAELLIEDHEGRPRPIKTWARYLRWLMDRPGGRRIDVEGALDEIEDLPESLEGEVQADVGDYPSTDFSPTPLLSKALDLAVASLEMLGIQAWVQHNGTDYEIATFAERVLAGEIA